MPSLPEPAADRAGEASRPSRRWPLLLALAAVLVALWLVAWLAVGATTCPRRGSVDWLPCVVAPSGDGADADAATG